MIDFDGLYALHARDVFRFALSLSGNRAMAEDITSETFLRVWSARDRVDLATVIGYLMTIARHLYLEEARGDRGRHAPGCDREDAAPGPYALAEGRAELDAVLADLQTLAEPDRAALLMRAQDQMPYEEIAAALGISIGAAKVKSAPGAPQDRRIAHESGGTVVMNVTREIVKDLLPLYAAGEASAESRAAVEEWLRTDPELVRLAAELRDDGAPPPATPVTPASGRAALAATKALLRRRSWLFALALLFTGLPVSFAFDSSGVRFFMLRDAPLVSSICLAAALGLWIAHGVVTRRLRVTGL